VTTRISAKKIGIATVFIIAFIILALALISAYLENYGGDDMGKYKIFVEVVNAGQENVTLYLDGKNMGTFGNGGGLEFDVIGNRHELKAVRADGRELKAAVNPNSLWIVNLERNAIYGD